MPLVVTPARAHIPMSNHSINPTDDLFVDFCDSDVNWSFLLFLRPERQQAIGVVRAFAVSVLLGLPLGLFGSILIGLIARELGKTPPAVFLFPAVLTALYFVSAQLTVFAAWNRRAARLARTPLR